MARLKIFTITQNEDTLRQVSKELDPSLLFQKDWQEFINDFKETMYAADGVGLAAPQVGKNLRLIAIDIEGEPLVMVNPQITKKSWLRATDGEGCLSVPKIYGPVKRHKKITVKFIDEKGKQQKNIYRDLAARVIQHEVDHLDGVLFIDKISK